MTILFFIILPLVTILLAIVLQKLLRNPILVAILAFAVFLILASTVFTVDFLINAIVYTILAYITAVIVKLISCFIKKIDCHSCNNCENTLQEDIAGLQNSICGLEKNIDSLNNNIDNLTDVLSDLINNNGNNNCGCNNRMLRR